MARANLRRLEEGKLYYSISEVCSMTGLEQHVLRYWESEFPQLRPKKNRSGNRAYRNKEIKIIRYIKYLLYDELYTIPGAKKKMADANVAELEGQISFIRMAPTSPPAPRSPDLESDEIGPEEEDLSEEPGPEIQAAASGPSDTARGSDSADEERRLRGELIALKQNLQDLLRALGAAAPVEAAGGRTV